MPTLFYHNTENIGNNCFHKTIGNSYIQMNRPSKGATKNHKRSNINTTPHRLKSGEQHFDKQQIIKTKIPAEHNKRKVTLLELPHVESSDRKVSGELGRPISLYSNHFPMDINIPNGGTVFHYHVDFTLPNGAEARKCHRPLLVRAVERMKVAYQDVFGDQFSIVFDGQTNIYSFRDLTLPTGRKFSIGNKATSNFDKNSNIAESSIQSSNFDVEVQDDNKRLIRIGVRIRKVGGRHGLDVTQQVADFLHHGSKGGGSNSTSINESLQVLNIILGMTPLLHFECAGKSYFNPGAIANNRNSTRNHDGSGSSVLDLGHGKSVWFGTFQAVRMGKKPYLNVDLAHRPAYNKQPLIDFLVSALDRGQNHRQQCKPTVERLMYLHQNEKYRLNDEIRELKVQYTRPDGEKRSYRINKLVESALRQTISVGTDGKKITVQNYFKMQYNYQLKYPQAPCVHVGKLTGTNYLPVELVEIKDQLAPNSKPLSDAESFKMKQGTSLRPDHRKQRIEKKLLDLNNAFQEDPYAKAFGISISDKMTQVEGRVLPPPTMKYRNTENEYVEVSHCGGKWTMSSAHGGGRDGDKLFLKTNAIQRWGILDLAEVPDSQLNTFIDQLIKEAECRGLEISGKPIYRHANFNDLAGCEARFWELCKNIEDDKQQHGKAQLVLVIAPAKRGNVYPCIKFIGDAVLGVPTQFILKTNVTGKPSPKKPQGPSPGTIHNLCLKINAKTGGTNHGLYERPQVLDKPTMILGK